MSTKRGCPERSWENPSNVNVLYKSFQVHRNMSRFSGFPLISSQTNLPLSLLTNGLTLHEVQQRWEGELSFHRSGDPGPLTELIFSEPRGKCRTHQHRPSVPGIHTHVTLCMWQLFSQHLGRQSACYGGGKKKKLQTITWSPNFDSSHHRQKASHEFMEFLGVRRSSLYHFPYGGGCCSQSDRAGANRDTPVHEAHSAGLCRFDIDRLEMELVPTASSPVWNVIEV